MISTFIEALRLRRWWVEPSLSVMYIKSQCHCTLPMRFLHFHPSPSGLRCFRRMPGKDAMVFVNVHPKQLLHHVVLHRLFARMYNETNTDCGWKINEICTLILLKTCWFSSIWKLDMCMFMLRDALKLGAFPPKAILLFDTVITAETYCWWNG